MLATKTLRLRVKDKHRKVLLAMAREVNTVWNFCNATSAKAIRERHQFLSGFDLQRLTNGYNRCEGVRIGSPTVQETCAGYAKARRQFRRTRLRWRVSNPAARNYSLGWVPFKARALQYKSGQVQFAGQRFGLWDSYGLADYAMRAGSFSEDARGRWYLNVVVQVEAAPGAGAAAVGIDLGCKVAATTSDGEKLRGRWYRALEADLGIAQRAGHKRRTKAIHAKITNRRKDALHKFSTALVRAHGAIFVGDVASAALVKTNLAKSTLDAGWAMLKTMLDYKSQWARVVFMEVNEACSTQTCSSCGVIPASSPKGRAGLGIREWTCAACGAVHDRDINSAKLILAAGHRRLAEGIPAL